MHDALLGNRLETWAVALAVGSGTLLLLYGGTTLAVRRLGKFAARTATFVDDLAVMVLAATHPLAFLVASAFVASHWLALSAPARAFVWHAAVATLLLQLARWSDMGVRGWLHHYRAEHTSQDVASTTSLAALGFVTRASIWLMGVLMVLATFGVNVTTLVASLGIGGIAVALSIQNILGDLFSSLSILLDKPFVVGDSIAVDSINGTVEYVGMKTTRLRSLDGEQIVFSNSDLLKSRIHNYRRMETRRVAFKISVAYEVSKQQLASIPAILRDSVKAQANVTFGRAHFKTYADSSIDFEVVYVIGNADYDLYMDIQQAINLAIFDRFAEAGIPFAYPTRTIRLITPQSLAGAFSETAS